MEARISQLESELVRLTVALDAEKAYRLELEDEMNFLLSENTALRAQLATVQVANEVGKQNEAQTSNLTHKSTINLSSHSGEKVLQIHQACGDKNAICCAFMSASRAGQPNDIIFCGGVDACVSAYDSLSGSCIGKWIMSAPVLSLDVFGRKVACGMMDGSHAVITLQGFGGDITQQDTTAVVAEVAHWRQHGKYVVHVVWSPCGQYLCTVSHDKTVGIYRVSEEALALVRTVACNTTPECATFLMVNTNAAKEDRDQATATAPDAAAGRAAEAGPEEPDSLDEYFAQLARKKAEAEQSAAAVAAVDDASEIASSTAHSAQSGAGEEEGSEHGQEPRLELVLGLRDVPYLLYIDCETGTSRQVSLNENAWDTHVSFTPLSLAVSPGGDRLLVATDKGMHILLEAGSNRRLQIFSGHSCGAYGKPSVCWSWRGDFVYSNSDDENVVYVYCAQSGKVVDRLVGHGKGIVRGVAAHKSKDLLLSASYDKSVILWKSSNTEGCK